MRLMGMVVAVALVLSLCSSAYARKLYPGEVVYVKSAVADVNGDGKQDSIRIDLPKNNRSGDYVLHVNGKSFKGTLWGAVGFRVVNINTSDKLKEIAVHTDGPSDDFEDDLYWYDGKRIRYIKRLGGGALFPGNGSVLVSERIDEFVGFTAFIREKYLLASNKILKRVPQEMYYFGITPKVRKSFPIYYSRGSNRVVAILAAGSKVELVAFAPAQRDTTGRMKKNPGDSFLLKSQTGLMGWTKVSASHLVDLPMAD